MKNDDTDTDMTNYRKRLHMHKKRLAVQKILELTIIREIFFVLAQDFKNQNVSFYHRVSLLIHIMILLLKSILETLFSSVIIPRIF